MRRGSLGPTLVIERRGKHGRKRGRRLALRQVRQRAAATRQLQSSFLRERHPRSNDHTMMSFIAPIMPDRRVIR